MTVLTNAGTEINPPDQNYTMLQAFDWYTPGGGVYYKDFIKKVPELAAMGITACWLPPPTKASSQNGNGYDIYDLWDLGEFDQKGGVATKWGTIEELKEAVQVAKDNGINVYIDAVLNHKAGADFPEKFLATEVDNNDRTKEVSGTYDIEGWTGFNFPGRKKKYSEMEWHSYHFTGVDYDNINQKKAIFKIKGDGKTWSKNVDTENTNYDYLMYADNDVYHPDVRNDLKNWGVWVVKETGARGFRFDAVKHIDSKFISEFIQHVRKELDKPGLFAVGEFWKDSIESLENYLGQLGSQFSVFDTTLHYNFKEASDAGSNYDLCKIFDGTLVQKMPVDSVTLVDNHDTQPYQALESWVSPQFKPLAYALILLRGDGYPCVFNGDLYGITGAGPDGDKTFEPVSQLQDFIKARRWLAYGPTRDYFDHPNCVGWVRTGDEVHDGIAIVLCNGDEGRKRMEVGKEHAGEVWYDILGWHDGRITIGDDGWAEFLCPAHSVSIWAKEGFKGNEHFKKD